MEEAAIALLGERETAGSGQVSMGARRRRGQDYDTGYIGPQEYRGTRRTEAKDLPKWGSHFPGTRFKGSEKAVRPFGSFAPPTSLITRQLTEGTRMTGRQAEVAPPGNFTGGI